MTRIGIYTPKSTRDWHLYHVFQDPEFISDVQTLTWLQKRRDTRAIPFLQAMTKEYAITQGEIGIYKVSSRIPLNPYDKRAWLDLNDDGSISIKFNIENVTIADIQECADAVQCLQSNIWNIRPTRRRAPNETNLIYSVFKERQRGLSFPAILDLYAQGKLPGYSGSRTQYLSDRSLEMLYRRHKPM
jgi:hypothetical protein